MFIYFLCLIRMVNFSMVHLDSWSGSLWSVTLRNASLRFVFSHYMSLYNHMIHNGFCICSPLHVPSILRQTYGFPILNQGARAWPEGVLQLGEGKNASLVFVFPYCSSISDQQNDETSAALETVCVLPWSMESMVTRSPGQNWIKQAPLTPREAWRGA